MTDPQPKIKNANLTVNYEDGSKSVVEIEGHFDFGFGEDRRVEAVEQWGSLTFSPSRKARIALYNIDEATLTKHERPLAPGDFVTYGKAGRHIVKLVSRDPDRTDRNPAWWVDREDGTRTWALEVHMRRVEVEIKTTETWTIKS